MSVGMKKARPCEGPGFFVPLAGELEDDLSSKMST
jgi:hypothetical protein